MSTMVILNVVLAIFIATAILSLLVWGIVTDATMAIVHSRGARSRWRARAAHFPMPSRRGGLNVKKPSVGPEF